MCVHWEVCVLLCDVMFSGVAGSEPASGQVLKVKGMQFCPSVVSLILSLIGQPTRVSQPGHHLTNPSEGGREGGGQGEVIH